MTVFPTWYPDKGSADSTDKVWASDWLTNFNITVWEVWDKNFADKSTSDLSEWTNEYYTTAKVVTDTTWKADKANVLELDNTDAFTPTTDYEPATKKYVDDFPVPSATTSIEWIVQRSTDAEATTSTNTTKYVTPDQLPKTAILQATRLFSDWGWIVNIPHWLSRTPKYIEIVGMARASDSISSDITLHSEWYSDWVTNACTAAYMFDAGSSPWKLTIQQSTLCIFMQNWTSSWRESQSASVTFDWTNIIFSWWRWTSWSDPASWATINMTFIAHA